MSQQPRGKGQNLTFISVSCSVMSDSAFLWTVARQASLSKKFSRWEYWSGLPFLQYSCLESYWRTAMCKILDSRYSTLVNRYLIYSRQEELCYKGIWQSNGDSETSTFGLTTKSFNHSQPRGSCDMFVNCTWVNMVVTHGILTRQLQSL